MKVDNIFDPTVEPLDEDYRCLRDDPRFQCERSVVEELWDKYRPYADSNFPSGIAKQFHSRFWEMYLTCALLEAGLRVMPKTRDSGPDICLRHNNSYIWVEAVAPGRGCGLDAVPPHKFGIRAKVPEEQILLRYTSAIKEKYEAYQKYVENNVISALDPYVIAVNGGKVPYSFIRDRIPRIIKAVLPIGPYSTTINPDTLEIISSGYSYRPEIEKKSGSPVPTNVFLDEKYAGISGVLFSNILVTSAGGATGEDFVFFHNRDADNRVPKGWLKLGREYWLENDRLHERIWRKL